MDYDEWKTLGNPYLNSHSYGHLRGKQANKTELQREMRLPGAKGHSAVRHRLARGRSKRRGHSIAALQEMLAADMQFVLLGSGEREYERAWRKLADRYPAKCAVKIGFDTGLSHRIEAGCDFYLMPSRFEPCGLNQMYSLRYGTCLSCA